jgi:hypothetical protein
MKSAASLSVEVQPSRRAVFLFLCVYVLALWSMLLSNLAGIWLVMGALVWVIIGLVEVRRWHSKHVQHWQLFSSDEPLPADMDHVQSMWVESSHDLRWLVAIQGLDPRRRRRHLVVWSDSLRSDAMRDLRVWLSSR